MDKSSCVGSTKMKPVTDRGRKAIQVMASNLEKINKTRRTEIKKLPSSSEDDTAWGILNLNLSANDVKSC